MNINVPDTIRKHEPALAEFVDGMIFKLHVNSHKDVLEPDHIPGLIDKMIEELAEFRDQYATDKHDPNTLAETWDAANFWFLIYASLRQEGVATMRERFIEEYYDVVPDQGKIFCVKARSGSRYKPGDEITGTKNHKGEVVIRSQSASGGFAVTLLRSHIIWWKQTGKWPNEEVLRQNNEASDDRIENLYVIGESGREEDGGYYVKPPFVRQYLPKGREHTSTYGKWAYQRRHMFKLVAVGYWDTAEEAASEGLKAWKAKVEEMQHART